MTSPERGSHATVLGPRPPEHRRRRHCVGRHRIWTGSGVPLHAPSVRRRRIQFGKRTGSVANAAGHGDHRNAHDRRPRGVPRPDPQAGPGAGRSPRSGQLRAPVSFFSREECLQRLRGQIAAGKPIIGGGAGTGISARCAEAGSIDLIIIYNSGRFRMAGRGSLSGMMPYGDANQIVVEMAREVLPVVRHTPVLAGVCGTDPFRIMKLFLREIQALGFSGVQNFPTVGLIDGQFRQNLEETEMGFGLEVDMIRQASELGLLTCPYVFNEDEARAMARAGADVLIPHMGLTTKGTIGAKTALTLPEAAERVQAMHDAAKSVNAEVLVLCHGGPIAEPEDAAYVLANTKGVVGFYGASSIERLPTEVAITECTRRFKALSFRK